MFNEITAVIPVRRGSKRVVGKNLRPFTQSGLDSKKHSLLSWKITQLSQVIEPKNILVSSDWPEALEVAKTLGCSTHVRPDWLCSADAPFEEVILEIAKQVETEHMIWTPVTSPFVGPRVLKSFLEKYLASESTLQSNGLLLVSEIRDYFFLSGKPLNFPVGNGHVQTQDIAPVTRWSWALGARPTRVVVENKYMFGDKPEFVNAEILTTFDINDEIEFLMAQNLVSLYFEIEAGV